MNNTTKKMTKRDYFTILRNAYPTTAENYNEVIGYIDHELELLANKNRADNKANKERHDQNEVIQQGILEFMEIGKKYTISNLIKDCPACDGLSHPKVTSLIHDLKNREMIVRTEEKRQAYFSLA